MVHEPSTSTEPAEGFDVVLERLRQVVERLETGNLSLEESLDIFEQGVRLSRQAAEMLERAEKRVEVLVQSRDGTVTTAPFEKVVGEKESDGREP